MHQKSDGAGMMIFITIEELTKFADVARSSCPSGPLGLRFADCKIPHPPTPWGESGRTGGEGAIPGENRGQAPMHQKAQCIAIMRRGLQMLRSQCIAQHRSHMEGTFGGLLTRGTLVAFEPFQY